MAAAWTTCLSSACQWDAAGIRAGWLSLTRPEPVDPGRLTGLAEQFRATAEENPVLHEATQSYLAAAAPAAHPVHYPRPAKTPQQENYRWFVENEKVVNKEIAEGWALPHVRAAEQRLPYSPEDSGKPRSTAGSRRATGQASARTSGRGDRGGRQRRR